MFLLRPDVVFLNHGSYGACPQPVFEAYQRWQLELERQPVDFLHYRYPELMRTARDRLGAYLGCDPDELVYVPNVTTALNVVARSIALAVGDEVLATDHEYGALVKTWTFLCEPRGARYVPVELPCPIESAEQVVDAVWSRVTDRTKVLFMSHITSPTAVTLPIGPLVRRARDAGILTVIDGAHAPGQIPLDLHELGADFYGGNCHKWMCAPKGSGFLYARRELQPLLEPLIVSWGWPGSFIEVQQRQGTRDIAAYLAVPSAIDFQEAHDWPAVRDACHALARHARSLLAEIGGMRPLIPDSPEWYAQMACVPFPFPDAEAARTRLWTERKIEVPVMSWNGRALVRVSIQAYNTEADVDALAAGLRDLVKEGAG
jgi:isopenicillin-N epimerase